MTYANTWYVLAFLFISTSDHAAAMDATFAFLSPRQSTVYASLPISVSSPPLGHSPLISWIWGLQLEQYAAWTSDVTWVDIFDSAIYKLTIFSCMHIRSATHHFLQNPQSCSISIFHLYLKEDARDTRQLEQAIRKCGAHSVGVSKWSFHDHRRIPVA